MFFPTWFGNENVLVVVCLLASLDAAWPGWRQELRLDHIKQHVCHWFAAFNFFEEKRENKKNPLPISQCPVVEILSPVFPPSPLSLSSLLFLSFCFVKGKKHKKPTTTCFLRSRVCECESVSSREPRGDTLSVSESQSDWSPFRGIDG